MANFTPQEIEEFLQEFFDVVGTRQYVGARYVPLFGRKGEQTIEWDDDAPYEPLTIVLHQGNSYTSRRYVPEGIDIANTEYWAETGAYNAQVAQYRQEVIALSDSFADLESDLTTWKTETEAEIDAELQSLEAWKTQTETEIGEEIAGHGVPANLSVLCIGDSWGTGVGADGVGWPARIQAMGVFGSVTNNSAGGYSFNLPSHSFITLLESAFSTQDERDAINRVIIVGGANAASTAGYQADVIACVARARQLYPNAIVYVGANSPNHHSKWRTETTQQIIDGAIEGGACPIEGLDMTCSFSVGWTDDNWHLTDYEDVAKTIVSCLLGDTVTFTPMHDFAWESFEANTDLFPNLHLTYFLGAQYGTKAFIKCTVDFGVVPNDITVPSRDPLKLFTIKERNCVYLGVSRTVSTRYLKPDKQEGTFTDSFLYFVVPTRITGALSDYYGVYPSFCIFHIGTQPTTIAAADISNKTLSFEIIWDLTEPFPDNFDALYWYETLQPES